VQQDWIDLLRKEVGEFAVRDLHRMLDGFAPLPRTNAFGPCFERTSKPMRRYELGFDPAVLTESPRIVHGLVRGSAAEGAGLRNGDEIVKPVPQDRIQGMQDENIHLAVRRSDAMMDISYLPRGETVPAWQWERVAGSEAPAECMR
jgi:predicted metalloprotease with PDZ domain